APGWTLQGDGEEYAWFDREALHAFDRDQLLAISALLDEFEAVKEDIIFAALQRLNMVKGKGRPKKGVERWNVVCFNAANHSTPENSSEASYWPPQGDKPPGFKCLHAGCSAKNIKKLIAWLKDNDPAYREALAEQAREAKRGDKTKACHVNADGSFWQE